MKTKSLPKLKADLQKVFNAYIRARDEGKPWISCGQMKDLQAGHYYPVQGYEGLRFDEYNVHGECAGCNCFNQAHLIFYTENLKERIGEKEYYFLKLRASNYKQNGYKWSRYELAEMIELYKKKVAELKN